MFIILFLKKKKIERIARECGDLRGTTVIEVGAGPGSLTRSLLELNAAKVIAVEKDKRFLPALEFLKESSQGRLEIVHGDMLDTDEAALLLQSGAKRCSWEEPCSVRLLGNLPFGVATQLFIKWLRQIPERQGLFSFGRVPLVLMFQKEVAQRIVAGPGSKEYGRMSVMTAYAASAKYCFTVGGKAFVPPPKVDAGVVRIEPLLEPPHRVDDYARLEELVRDVFQHRRKQVRNCFDATAVDVDGLLSRSGVDGRSRPEQLSVEHWVHLCQNFEKYKI